MTNLFLLSENITNGSNQIFLNFAFTASILCGIFVIISKNPIVSVLFLIGLFLNVAAYLMLLGMNFIGLSYLLVYVGAVSILFLFILMLINVRISELVADTSNSIPLAVLVGIIFNLVVYEILPGNDIKFTTYIYDINKKIVDLLDPNDMSFSGLRFILFPDNQLRSVKISFVSSQTWDGSLAETSHITTLGNIIYTAYPIWLIITSIVLLLAMVGAIVITIKQKN